MCVDASISSLQHVYNNNIFRFLLSRSPFLYLCGCFSQSAVTHNDRTDKMAVNMMWTAPADGQLQFLYAYVFGFGCDYKPLHVQSCMGGYRG